MQPSDSSHDSQPITDRGRHLPNRGFKLHGITAATAIGFRHAIAIGLLTLVQILFSIPVEAENKPGFHEIKEIFSKHCLDCHGFSEPDGNLILENHEGLLKGGESGAVVVAGQSAESLLIKMVEGKFEKNGEKKTMPPGKRKKLTQPEIDLLKNYVDAGAPAPAGTTVSELRTPKILPRGTPKNAVHGLAWSEMTLALARYGEVEIRDSETRQLIRTLKGHLGTVNTVQFVPQGKVMIAAGGLAGLGGQIKIWNVTEGKLIRSIDTHRDAIYALAISPDGKTMATGSYDKQIKLWDLESGNELQTLEGHNGAIFGLAFRPDGKILASASSDRTIKLWETSTGKRTDTLSQPTREQYAVAWNQKGNRLFAGGVDNRIRIWEVSEKATETSNQILESQFAHEGTILTLALSSDGRKLVSSASDGSVKLWSAEPLALEQSFELQPDMPTAAVFTGKENDVTVGRLDGSFQIYESKTGKPRPVPKPELTRLEPRGLQRGSTALLRVLGKNLGEIKAVKFNDTNITGSVVSSNAVASDTVQLEVSIAPDMKPGTYDLSLFNEAGEIGKLKLLVDDLRQIHKNPASVAGTNTMPFAYWGSVETGPDEIWIHAEKGQQIIFNVEAKSLSSKLNPVLQLFDAQGTLLAHNNGYQNGDPLLVWEAPGAGSFRLMVDDQMMATAAENFYRISVGTFPFVVGVHPLSVKVGHEQEVSLVGYNLVPGTKMKITQAKPGDNTVELDPAKYRSRKTMTVLGETLWQAEEVEPNNEPATAGLIKIPGVAHGRFMSESKTRDHDYYKFEAKTGEEIVIETDAARRGSPADTRIEIFSENGQKVPRVLLQAMRNTAINFRGVDANGTALRIDHYEEMELNDYVYFNGDLLRILRMPQGPDSDVIFYSSGGKRLAYFHTTAVAHALDEAGHVVLPLAPGTKPSGNGLPVFTLYFENDDDSERKLGTDSKIYFKAPANGFYWIKVTESSGSNGDRYSYRLILRQPKPDFLISLDKKNLSLNKGSGQSFTLTAERLDGFDGDIVIRAENLPADFTISNPLIVQAGHFSATGTINIEENTTFTNEAAEIKLVAGAMLNGQETSKSVAGFSSIKIAGEKPKLIVSLEAYSGQDAHAPANATNKVNAGIRIQPGETVPAWLAIDRQGHDELVTFNVENLPHGVIVDNIGLNGITFLKGENARKIFLTAARWVPSGERFCYAVENQAGRQTSKPVLLQIVTPKKAATASLNQN